MPSLNSQSLDIDQFEELLDKRSQSGIFNEEEKSYESFTQNQLSNIISKQELVDEKANRIANQYQRDRAEQYPSYADQLDTIYHQGLDAWKAEIKKVKDQFPKPE